MDKITRILLSLYVLNICNAAVIQFSVIEESLPGNFGQISKEANELKVYNATEIQKLRFTIANLASASDYVKTLFKINSTSSELSTTKSIDRETLCSLASTCCPGSDLCAIDLRITVHLVGKFVHLLYVTISIIDANDHAPVFDPKVLNKTVMETKLVGQVWKLPSAVDSDSGQNAMLEYSLKDQTNTFELQITNSGSLASVFIKNTKELDRETVPYYKLYLTANDKGSPQQTGTLTINVDIEDDNDNTPKFVEDNYKVNVPENVKIGTSIIKVSAVDADIGKNGDIVYLISLDASSAILNTFNIDAKTGWISVKKDLDYEKIPSYFIPIEAKDQGTKVLSRISTVTVSVQDVNDLAPVINTYLLTQGGQPYISESTPINTRIAGIETTDSDGSLKNRRVSCSVDNNHFQLEINPSLDGGFYLKSAVKLDREVSSTESIVITCTDSGSPPLKSNKTLNFGVTDVNDEAPRFSSPSYSAPVTENDPPSTFLLTVSAKDPDLGMNAEVRYRMGVDGQDVATINSKTGIVYSKISFNREAMPKVIFHVIAYDLGTGALSSSAEVTINVADKNDNQPFFDKEWSFPVSEAAAPHTDVGKMYAKDLDLGLNAQIVYTFKTASPTDFFEMSPDGTISTRRTLDREFKSKFEYTVIAKDRGTPPLSGSTTVTLTVMDANDNQPDIIFPNSHNNTIFISYLEPVNYVVTRILATDKDNGLSGIIEYYIQKGNDGGLFLIDENTGEISIAREMTSDDARVHKLTIEVRDKGVPQTSNVATLNIFVDGSGKAISMGGQYLNENTSRRNLIIVVTLSIFSGILCLVLIIAIICIKRKDRDNHNYNVKTEAQKIFSRNRSSFNDTSSKSSESKKEVSFTLDNEISTTPSGFMNNFGKGHHPSLSSSHINPNNLEHPRACSSLIHSGTPERICTLQNGLEINNLSGQKKSKKHDWTPSYDERKVQDLRDMLKRNGDSTSDMSSCSDSGRGGSDEDIMYLQTQTVIDLSTDELITSPQKRHIYNPKSTFRNIHFTPSMGKHDIKNIGNASLSFNGSCSDNCKSTDCLCVNNTSIKISNTPLNSSGKSNKVRFTLPDDTTLGDLEDVLSVTSEKSDGASTTSGVYIIDPEALCMEIDNLFFIQESVI